MKNKVLSSITLVFMATLPFVALADVVSLQPLSAANTTPAPVTPSPLACFDLRNTLKKGSTGYEVRGLQFDLIQQGASIPVSEYGTYGDATLAGVNAFQAKFASEILSNNSAPTGLVGRMTRAKLNSLYGCSVTSPVAAAPTGAIPASVVLNIKNVGLDSNGVTVVSCNQSPTSIPSFPVRVRLNGIIRDFNVAGALTAGSCDTSVIPYSAWGLTYDPGTTYGVVTAIDPNGMYKTAQITYPLNGTTTLAIPAISGAHLSVRGITIKTNGIQGTLCNLGTSDLANYPVRITVNGTSKDVDVPSVHLHGICQSVTWTYDMFGLGTPSAGTLITATINIDPNNVIQETNEFDNSATVSGSI